MRERGHVPQVGAQDLELRNSPVVQEVNEDMDDVTLEVSDRSVCYFNAKAYPHGAFVCSGSELLRCERGLWFSEGGCDPDNP